MSTRNNDITELRSHLFDTIRELRQPGADIERAKAIAELAQTVINSAKVEVEHIKLTGGSGSGFIPDTADTVTKLPNNVRVHRLKG